VAGGEIQEGLDGPRLRQLLLEQMGHTRREEDEASEDSGPGLPLASSQAQPPR
jgi:hypothetical protein